MDEIGGACTFDIVSKLQQLESVRPLALSPISAHHPSLPLTSDTWKRTQAIIIRICQKCMICRHSASKLCPNCAMAGPFSACMYCGSICCQVLCWRMLYCIVVVCWGIVNVVMADWASREGWSSISSGLTASEETHLCKDEMGRSWPGQGFCKTKRDLWEIRSRAEQDNWQQPLPA